MLNGLNHDIPAGKLKCGRVHGLERSRLIIDLGRQPPCDTVPSREPLVVLEISYPVAVPRYGSGPGSVGP
jgi:hypothetical protein